MTTSNSPSRSQPRPPKRFTPDPFEYHQELELTIDTLTNLGQGLGRVDGWVVFVPFSLPGEKVRARVFRNHKAHSEADLIEILEASPHRIEARCPLFGECGGCQYQNFSYEQQLLWKQRQVAELLEHLAGIDAEQCPVDAVIPSPDQWGYRTKITPHFQLPPKSDPDRRIREIGFLKAGRRHQLVDVVACPIASPAINEALPEVRADVHRRALEYRKGATLLLRDSASGEICTDNTESCEERVGELKFEFHAGEFFQNNRSILPAFTSHVADQASSTGATTLIDAYCGSGLFSICCADRFERVIGIEVSQSSVDWAHRNARLNGIENAEFQHGDAAAIFDKETVGDIDPTRCAVVIDPPRKGSSREFLDQLIAFAPATVIYVSCNPATQMRDLLQLKEHYQLTRVQPFDLFPHTRHLECVITLRTNA
jgi:23S rRNA (uracil1939-C5)-methyltransferase/tRNA (uracil-5-)-methyltransferase